MKRWTIIMGIHRSGTSCVAGVLHHLGINMGLRLLPAHESNPRGFFEDEAARKLHMAMMGPWERPVVNITHELFRQYHAYFRERESYYDHLGLKDPRLCYLLKETLSHIDIRGLKIIDVHRPVRAIVESIVKWQPMTADQAQVVVASYDLERSRGLYLTAGRGVPVLDVWYDQLVSDPARVVGVIAGFLGVDVSEEAVEFVEPGLRQLDLRSWRIDHWLCEVLGLSMKVGLRMFRYESVLVSVSPDRHIS